MPSVPTSPRSTGPPRAWPAYRGRGDGRAITSRIVADGIPRGADLAHLQSSEDGYPLYQSMGFRTVETWTYLMSGPNVE